MPTWRCLLTTAIPCPGTAGIDFEGALEVVGSVLVSVRLCGIRVVHELRGFRLEVPRADGSHMASASRIRLVEIRLFLLSDALWF